MRLIVKKLVVFLVIGYMLTACLSWSKTDYPSNNQDQYLKSTNGATIVVPKPLTNSNLSDFYILPDQKQNAKASVLPPD
jgi:uncharacterized lipoprotein